MFFNIRKERRRTGKIDKLPVALKDSVDNLLLAGAPYREIVQFLRENDVELSQQAVSNYARRFLATTQQLRMAHENYRFLSEEIERNPDLDTTEGIVRIVSNALLMQLANATPEDWDGLDMRTLLREATALVKVTAHKRRSDALNESDSEKAAKRVTVDLFHAISQSDPVLFEKMRMEVEKQAALLEEKEKNKR